MDPQNPTYNIRQNNQLKPIFIFYVLDANIKINTTTQNRNMNSIHPQNILNNFLIYDVFLNNFFKFMMSLNHKLKNFKFP